MLGSLLTFHTRHLCTCTFLYEEEGWVGEGRVVLLKYLNDKWQKFSLLWLSNRRRACQWYLVVCSQVVSNLVQEWGNFVHVCECYRKLQVPAGPSVEVQWRI